MLGSAQRIPPSNPWTDGSNSASSLKKQLVLLSATRTSEIISDMVISQ